MLLLAFYLRLTLTPFSACVHTCVCVAHRGVCMLYVFMVCVCLCVCVHIKARSHPLTSFLKCLLCCLWGTDSLGCPGNCQFKRGWVLSEHLGICYLHLPRWDYKPGPWPPAFLHELWRCTIGLHDFAESTFLTEVSPQPPQCLHIDSISSPR